MNKYNPNKKYAFDLLKKYVKMLLLNSVLNKLQDNRKNNIEDFINKLKDNAKDDKLNKLLNVNNDIWKKLLLNAIKKWQTKKDEIVKEEEKKIEEEKKEEEKNTKKKTNLKKIVYKKDNINNNNLAIALKIWRRNIQTKKLEDAADKIKKYLNKKLNDLKAKNNWKKLVKLLRKNNYIKNEPVDILKKLIIKNALDKLNDILRKTVKKNSFNDVTNKTKFVNQIKSLDNVVDKVNNTTNNFLLRHYLNKWKNTKDKTNQREKSVDKLVDVLDKINKLKSVEILNSVFLLKKFLHDLPYIRAIDFFNRLKKIYELKKKLSTLGDTLIKTKKDLDDKNKEKFIKQLYKLYVQRTLEKFIKKLLHMQKTKTKEISKNFIKKVKRKQMKTLESITKSIKEGKHDTKPTTFKFKAHITNPKNIVLDDEDEYEKVYNNIIRNKPIDYSKIKSTDKTTKPTEEDEESTITKQKDKKKPKPLDDDIEYTKTKPKDKIRTKTNEDEDDYTTTKSRGSRTKSKPNEKTRMNTIDDDEDYIKGKPRNKSRVDTFDDNEIIRTGDRSKSRPNDRNRFKDNVNEPITESEDENECLDVIHDGTIHPRKSKKKVIKRKPITYILPHFVDYLNRKIKNRKKESFDKIRNTEKYQKFIKYIIEYINKLLKNPKEDFFDRLKNIQHISSTKGPLLNELYSLLRKYIIRKWMAELNPIHRMYKLFYLFKLTFMFKGMTEKRFIREIIRKWRFISFAKIMAKRKLELMYKNLHVSYLQMANEFFGEEETTNTTSVLKEFERFGTDIGMWSNESPEKVPESGYCKKVKRKYVFEPIRVENVEGLYPEVQKLYKTEIRKESVSPHKSSMKGKSGTTIKTSDKIVFEDDNLNEEINSRNKNKNYMKEKGGSDNIHKIKYEENDDDKIYMEGEEEKMNESERIHNMKDDNNLEEEDIKDSSYNKGSFNKDENIKDHSSGKNYKDSNLEDENLESSNISNPEEKEEVERKENYKTKGRTGKR